MNTESREFSLGHILTISTEVLFTPSEDGIYEILNYMTGDDLRKHALLRAADVCGPILREQFPWLRDIDVSHVNPQNVWEVYADLVSQYGEYHRVYPLGFEDWEEKDPVQEWIDIKGNDNIVVVKLDEPSPYGDISWSDNGNSHEDC